MEQAVLFRRALTSAGAAPYPQSNLLNVLYVYCTVSSHSDSLAHSPLPKGSPTDPLHETPLLPLFQAPAVAQSQNQELPLALAPELAPALGLAPSPSPSLGLAWEGASHALAVTPPQLPCAMESPLPPACPWHWGSVPPYARACALGSLQAPLCPCSPTPPLLLLCTAL